MSAAEPAVLAKRCKALCDIWDSLGPRFESHSRQCVCAHTLSTPIAETLPWSTAEGEIVVATSPSFKKEEVVLTRVRPQSKESKGEDTRKKGKMTEKNVYC